jgi:transposase/transposase InsO family protein
MPTQLALKFDEVPITCPAQARYHAIAPCLVGVRSPTEVAVAQNLGYSTVTRWLRDFRAEGLPGLFPATEYPREPYTPERVIVMLVYFKCLVPKVGARELARIIQTTLGQTLHNETVKALLQRYFFWQYAEFRQALRYPVPTEPAALRLEMQRLQRQGWSEKHIAVLLQCHPRTVNKWLRRLKHAQAQTPVPPPTLWAQDLSRAPHRPPRKVYFGAIHATLILQKKYGYAGWFRLQGYLEADYGIYLGATTIKKIMALNRRVHLAPVRPVKEPAPRDSREGPPKSRHPFQHTYIDLRYLDAKPEGVQLYSCLLLEGLSRTILAGSLTPSMEVGVVLQMYFQALLRWGLWDEIISDHGGQFQSGDFARVNQRLGIHHEMYEKGHPWQNLIESQFGIQARIGEYHWERCPTIAAAVAFHRELIRDHNRLPHWAHRFRQDQKRTPLAVLGAAHGKQVEPAILQRAFGQRYCQRRIDAQGFVRLGRWKIYVEEGLPQTPVQLSYWEGKLRAEYGEHLLTEYQCRWGQSDTRPTALHQPTYHAHPFQTKQQNLFDPLWLRDPVAPSELPPAKTKPAVPTASQLRLYFGPELVKRAS